MERGDSQSIDARFVGQLTAVQVPLLVYVRSLLPGDPAARDVAQQANATIWAKRADFEPGTNFKTDTKPSRRASRNRGARIVTCCSTATREPNRSPSTRRGWGGA